jgi:endonuclease III
MPQAPTDVAAILDALERHHGKQAAWWPTDPYEFLVWWHCGYPQSDERCAKGWAALESQVGIAPRALLAAKPSQLAEVLKHGGMVPELRAERLKEIAMRVQDEFGGELEEFLVASFSFLEKDRTEGRGPRAGKPKTNDQPPTTSSAHKILKTFPNIGDPGADRILLFARMAPLAAIPSNNVQVLVRVLQGRERENYGQNYREAQQAIEAEIPPRFDARQRAYLLLKVHGQEICTRTNPKCDVCPLNSVCAYAAGKLRGRSKAAKVPGSRR